MRPKFVINHYYVLVVKGCREMWHGIYKTVAEAETMAILLTDLDVATSDEIEIEKIWVSKRA